jgi:prephenate dehydrogenase
LPDHDQHAPFNCIGIVGTGLIGGSIALAVKHVWPDVHVTGTPSRSGPLPAGLVDRVEADVATLARESDLVVLAVPVTVMPVVMAKIAAVESTAVVTDAGSTKRRVIHAARAAGLATFIGGHPMAGGERPGAGEARHDLFVARPWLLVSGTAPKAQEARLETFVTALGALPRWMAADEHDRVVAFVSHLPQVVAAALMNAAERAVARSGPQVAGNAFAEMTRLASSPVDMWKGICAENADFVAEALGVFLSELPAGRDLGDGKWVAEALSRSAAARDRWRSARRGKSGGD